MAGEILTIKGVGFKNTKGTVYFLSTNSKLGGESVLEWKDNTVRVVVPEGVVSNSIVRIYTSTEAIYSPILNVTKLPPKTLKVGYATFCGKSRKPLNNTWVKVYFWARQTNFTAIRSLKSL